MKLTTPIVGLSLAISVSGYAQQSYLGCYSDVGELHDQGPYTYQSDGYCLNKCYQYKRNYFALSRGNHCYCGDVAPEKKYLISDDKCNVPCAAWPLVMCGGHDEYTVYETGRLPRNSSASDDIPTSASTSDAVIKTSTASSTPAASPTSSSASSSNASSTSSVEPTPTENKASRRYSFLF